MAQLSIVHWNDAYNVTPQRVTPNSDGTIDVTQFAALLDQVRSNWPVRPDGARDGLSFFSGDLFSPSVESTVTRGSHLVPVMNELAPDASVVGNHDFDFGYLHLTELAKDSIYPWLLSNIIDQNTNKVPESLERFKILERSGVRIGIIGLVEQGWINSVGSWPTNFLFIDMVKTGKELSQLLQGEYQCDLVIALTHCLAHNDVQLAKDLLALSPSAQRNHSLAGDHGVDIIIGGHDHEYFISKGVTCWEGYDVSHPILETGDSSGTLVVKSGTDFRDLSVFTLELEDTPSGSVRKKVIKAVHGKRHSVQPGMPSSENMKKILDNVLTSVSKSMNVPVCISQVELDVRTQAVRSGESVAGNWLADVLRHAYDDTLEKQYGSGSDGIILTGGTLRGDKLYSAGDITLRNILEVLPFSDPIVVLEVSGEILWDALEAGLSRYEYLEGRFPVISGFRVSWDSRRPPGQRILSIRLSQDSNSGKVDGEPIKREKTGRTYKILMTDFVAEGHGGYTAFVGQKYLIDDEHGQILSSLVRKYLLGAAYINKTARLRGQNEDTNHLHWETTDIVSQEIQHRQEHASLTDLAEKLEPAVSKLLHQLRSNAHYVNHFNISAREHMSGVDHVDGGKLRKGSAEGAKSDNEQPSKEDLLIIHPVIDGRLKDEAKN